MNDFEVLAPPWRSRFALRPILALLVALVLAAGCSSNDEDKDNGGTPPEPPEPPEPLPCEYRLDPTPPAYAWTFDDAPVGQTTIRYFAPAAPDGLVILFDGGAGSLIWFNRIEPRLLVEALVDADFAVLALESEDPNDGNFDATDAATNDDIVNLQAAIDLAVNSGTVPAGTPLFYLGFSSGGYFGSLATRYVPANAMALSHVRGDEITFDATLNPSGPPPTLWVIGRNDTMVPPEDAVLEENLTNIAAAGVDNELYINEPIGPDYPAFARIADPGSAVIEQDSEDAVQQLEADGHLGDCRVPVGPASDADPTAFVAPSFTLTFQEEALRQLDELYGAHEITSDFSAEIVAFFAANR